MNAVLTAGKEVSRVNTAIVFNVAVEGGTPPYLYTYTPYTNSTPQTASEATSEAFYSVTPAVVGVQGMTCTVTDSDPIEPITVTVVALPVHITYADSRLEDIFLHLKRNGVNVYLPAHHVGECLERYVVVRPSLGAKVEGYSTFYQSYQLLMYVPRNETSQIEQYVEEIRGIMKPLQQQLMLRETYFRAMPYYEDSIKGYTVDLEYRLYRKISP